MTGVKHEVICKKKKNISETVSIIILSDSGIQDISTKKKQEHFVNKLASGRGHVFSNATFKSSNEMIKMIMVL